MSHGMQAYKGKSSVGLMQLAAFSVYKAAVHSAVLCCLQGIPDFILEDTYLLHKEFLFLLNNIAVCATVSHKLCT